MPTVQDSTHTNEAVGRLRGMLAATSAPMEEDTVPEPVERVAAPTPRTARAPDPQSHFTSQQVRWTPQLTDAEKLRVLGGFLRWVVARCDSTEAENNNAALLQQTIHEIQGAAGLAAVLISDQDS